MKKLTLTAIAASILFTASASAVDISHDYSYGSSVVTGTVNSHSKTHSDSQTFKFATDADAGRLDLGSTSLQAVGEDRITGVLPKGEEAHRYGLDSAGVDNNVAGTSFETSFTHSNANSRDTGDFSSVTVFNEATITVGSLSAGEGNRNTVYAQDMTGGSETAGYTDTVKVDYNTSANPSGTENGVEYKFDTSHTDFTSSVTDKQVTTRKNTITDYSFIK